MPPIRTRKMNYVSGLFAIGASAFFVGGLATSPVFAAPSASNGNTKILVCHLTRSGSNPYLAQEVAMSSVATYQSQGKYPGDIFPAFTYVDNKGQTVTVEGQNWTVTGEAIYNAGCVAAAPSPSPSPVTTPTSSPTTQAPSSSPVPSDPPSTPVQVVTSSAPSSPAPNSPAPSSSAPTSPTAQAPSTSTTSSTATTPTGPSAGSGVPAAGTPVTSESSVQAAAAQGAVQEAQSEVSITAQTGVGAPAPDYTTSNTLFASSVLMLLGAFGPKLAGRRGRHS